MPDQADLALLTTRTGITCPVLALHHLMASFCTLLSPAFHNGHFYHVLHTPYLNNHHCTSHLPDYGEMVSLLFPAEAHFSDEDWAADPSFLLPGYCSHDFLFRGLHYLGFHCLCWH